MAVAPPSISSVLVVYISQEPVPSLPPPTNAGGGGMKQWLPCPYVLCRNIYVRRLCGALSHIPLALSLSLSLSLSSLSLFDPWICLNRSFCRFLCLLCVRGTVGRLFFSSAAEHKQRGYSVRLWSNVYLFTSHPRVGFARFENRRHWKIQKKNSKA